MAVPYTLQKKIQSKFHISHPPMTRMKSSIHSYTYWPRIDQDIEKMAKECRGCQLAAKAPPIKIQLWPETNVPWTRLHIDNAGPLDGHYYLMWHDVGHSLCGWVWAAKRSGQNRLVERTDQLTEVEGSWQSRKTFEDAGLMNARKWVSIPSGFVGVSLEYTLVLAHRMHKSVTGFSLLALGANPSSWLFFFFRLLGGVFCVLVKEWEIHLARDEKNH